MLPPYSLAAPIGAGTLYNTSAAYCSIFFLLLSLSNHTKPENAQKAGADETTRKSDDYESIQAPYACLQRNPSV